MVYSKGDSLEVVVALQSAYLVIHPALELVPTRNLQRAQILAQAAQDAPVSTLRATVLLTETLGGFSSSSEVSGVAITGSSSSDSLMGLI